MQKNKNAARVGVVLVVLFLVSGVLLVLNHQKQKQVMHVTADNSVDVGTGYREISYKGKDYRYNSLVTTVLFAGIDSEGEIKATKKYAVAPRADSIYLIVMNKKSGRMSIVAFNRDTMTDVQAYTPGGKSLGEYVTHLGFAYTYGDGGEVSCENLRDAVSNLIQGIPITEYAVTNRSTMPAFNHLVGGVEVTVPNNELTEIHPEWKKGAVVTIQDDEVESYLRYRDTGKDFSNMGRLERQQSYITSYVDSLKQLLDQDANTVWSKIQESEDHLQTSITRNKYISMVNLMSGLAFDDSDFYQLKGEGKLGSDNHDEFYVDKEALLDLLVELLYEEV